MPDLCSCSSTTLNELAIAQFEEETCNAEEVQRKVLKEILERNADTLYLRNHGLDGRTDPLSFKTCLPLVAHAHLKPYFDRIVEGDRSPILTAEPIRTLSLSSGTTSDGQQKYLVLYKEILEDTVKLTKISSAYRARAFPIRPGRRMLELVFSGKLSTTSGGLTSGTATTHLFRSEQFKMKQESAQLRACSPDEVIRASDNRQAMYCHLLSALLYRNEVEIITSTFAYTIVEAFRTFEFQFDNLCRDIRLGQLSSFITEPALRSAMAQLLTLPNPELADKLVSICSVLNDWMEVIPQIWQNCKYIFSIMTGSMEPYLKRLSHYAGNLPLVSGDYGSTEAWIGVNTNPRAPPADAAFTVVPSFAYFEFIPYNTIQSAAASQFAAHDPSCLDDADIEEDVANTVGVTGVKVGHEYELVMTTYGGLYRYRLGDIVRVTGFLNASPQLAFVCRRNVVLTVNIDKNTERDLQKAVEQGVQTLQFHDSSADLVDFTSFADLSTSLSQGHYVIVWELKLNMQISTSSSADKDGQQEASRALLDASEEVERRRVMMTLANNGDVQAGGGESECGTVLRRGGRGGAERRLMVQGDESEVLQRCATRMDLAFVDPGYVGSRKAGTIGALELCVVEAGTFRSLVDRYLARASAALTQYKTPRCIASLDLRHLLRSKAYASAFSSAYLHS